jgi:hypothetical protein
MARTTQQKNDAFKLYDSLSFVQQQLAVDDYLNNNIFAGRNETPEQLREAVAFYYYDARQPLNSENGVE